MNISSVSLQNFRSYTAYQVTFDDHITLITGRNGTGKTNLLEAVHVLLQGSSFRAADRDMVRYGSEWWRIDGVIDGYGRQVRYEVVKKPSKQLIVQETAKRFTSSHRLPVVLFDPADILFVPGSPSRRRDTLDMMLCTLSSSYKTALNRYNRVLLQRNNALKQYLSEAQLRDMLFVWDISLVTYAQTLIVERQRLIDQLNERLPYYYSQIAGNLHNVLLRYDYSLSPKLSQSGLMELVNSTISTDILRRTTTTGPHRDDLIFVLNNSEAKTSASRGETRSLLLSLKLAYRDILAEQFGTQPLLLLDDVFSELDQVRRKNLLHNAVDNQIIMTDTHVNQFKKYYRIQLLDN